MRNPFRRARRTLGDDFLDAYGRIAAIDFNRYCDDHSGCPFPENAVIGAFWSDIPHARVLDEIENWRREQRSAIDQMRHVRPCFSRGSDFPSGASARSCVLSVQTILNALELRLEFAAEDLKAEGLETSTSMSVSE